MTDLEKEFLDDNVKTKLNSTRKKSLNSKKKGNSFELQVAKTLKQRFPGREFKRVPMSGGFFHHKERDEIKIDGKNNFIGDIMADEDFKFSIECKAYKEIEFWDLFNQSSFLWRFFDQCEGDSKIVNKIPLIIAKFNNKKPICFAKGNYENEVFSVKGWKCFWLDDFLEMGDEEFWEDKCCSNGLAEKRARS
jgi:hypothetical protein